MLSGSHRVEASGSLELVSEGDRLTGTAGEGWDCRLDAPRRVLEGDFQGPVLVGRLTVCQTGPQCPEVQTYPLLAFYNEEDRALVAHVRLREGCESPVVKEGRFILQPAGKAAPEEMVAAPPAPSAGSTPVAVTSPSAGGSSASALANKRGGRNAEAAKQASELGEKLYKEKNYVQAAQQFEISLAHDPGDKNWPAYMGRGSSRLMLGQVKEAIQDLERSRVANAKVSSTRHAGLFYVLGCAHAQNGDKKRAMEFMRQAVKANYPLHDVVEVDPIPKKLLGELPEFQELLKKSRDKAAAQTRGTVGPGTQKP
ncbi:tetratricopeptide repeat protein [Hyalangium rubrum]|uniref:Tetratricopeptide repeat protein n=1 Tax=Hyalangium rubrum TaxID=3103134 RepID=A0ABU5GVB8_9BACT|nr:hypothetical protein [Hyalangium sp. s54d21]MDY7224814.1 hypothetical protein [Hyalangium sp. s54d21]